jgi:hypothetical protein
MRRVILESPYAGDVDANVAYARACLGDCLRRDEAPIASHLLFTQPNVLDDTKPEERSLGMRAGFAWYDVAEAAVVYTDRGISRGMKAGIAQATQRGIPVEYRTLPAAVEVSPLSLSLELARVGLIATPAHLAELATDETAINAASSWARASLAYTEDHNSAPPPPMPSWLEPLTLRKDPTP